jgi:hypothetical protein
MRWGSVREREREEREMERGMDGGRQIETEIKR